MKINTPFGVQANADTLEQWVASVEKLSADYFTESSPAAILPCLIVC